MNQRKGFAVLLLFIIGIPLLMDFIMNYFVNHNGDRPAVSSILFSGYVLFLPKFLYYIIMASAVAYLVKPAKKEETGQSNE